MKLKRWIKLNWSYLSRVQLTPRGLYIFILVLRDSLKWCFRINLGNYLKHEGKLYIINNGVGVDYWDVLLVDEKLNIIRNEAGEAKSSCIKKVGARKYYQLSTPFSDFGKGFRFFMGYWYEIWVHGSWAYKDRPSKII